MRDLFFMDYAHERAHFLAPFWCIVIIATSVVKNPFERLIVKHPIHSTEDLGLAIRAVRKSSQVRQDDLAGAVGVSRRFTAEVERGKPTVQFGRVLRLLEELGITVSVDIPDDASRVLAILKSRQPSTRLKKNAGEPAGAEESKKSDA
ncbi:helix-turn-helix transcriptional regulator [Janthinobacterium sp. RB2R34]